MLLFIFRKNNFANHKQVKHHILISGYLLMLKETMAILKLCSTTMWAAHVLAFCNRTSQHAKVSVVSSCFCDGEDGALSTHLLFFLTNQCSELEFCLQLTISLLQCKQFKSNSSEVSLCCWITSIFTVFGHIDFLFVPTLQKLSDFKYLFLVVWLCLSVTHTEQTV